MEGLGSNSTQKVRNPRVVKPTYEVLPSNGQLTTDEALPRGNEVTTGEDTFSLLQQWSIQGYFEARARLDFLLAYGHLWRLREQRQEFLADINIGILRGDVARASL